MDPSKRSDLVWRLAGVVLAAAAVGRAQDASFARLGPADVRAFPRALSADGSIAVGDVSLAPGTGSQPFRWSLDIGLVPLGYLGTGHQGDSSGVSADGSVVVGYSTAELGPDAPYHAFRWTAATGMVDLGFLPGASDAYATGVSADGSVIVGYSGHQAFRWTPAGGMVALGSVPGAESSIAYGPSPDGMSYILQGHTRWANFTHLFLSTPSGLQDLGSLPGRPLSFYRGFAQNGVVVGRCVPANGGGNEVFRWSPGTGMVGLGFLSGHPEDSAPAGVSGDGELIVGSPANGETDAFGAFIWSPSEGMRGLRSVLIAGGAAAAAGWNPIQPLCVSADGSTIAGFGAPPCGSTDNWTAWIARLRPPTLPPDSSCYANCDCSTTVPRLSVSDFTCFLSRFTNNDPRADCDGSALPPQINVSDFVCFLNKYAQGCP